MQDWNKTNHLLAAVVKTARNVVDEAMPISRQHSIEPDEFVIPAWLYHGLRDAVDRFDSLVGHGRGRKKPEKEQ